MGTLFDDEELVRAREQRATAVEVANHDVGKISQLRETLNALYRHLAILRCEVKAWRNLAAEGDKLDGNTKQANIDLNEAMAMTDKMESLEDE